MIPEGQALLLILVMNGYPRDDDGEIGTKICNEVLLILKVMSEDMPY